MGKAFGYGLLVDDNPVDPIKVDTYVKEFVLMIPIELELPEYTLRDVFKIMSKIDVPTDQRQDLIRILRRRGYLKEEKGPDGYYFVLTKKTKLAPTLGE